MSLIEQAAKRLDELRRAGFEAAQSAPSREGLKAPAPVPAASQAHSPRVDLDLARLAAMGLVSPEDSRSRIAEEFRIIKRPLLGNVDLPREDRPERANLVMITSALPGEGKSFSSMNLAMSIAMELDRHVLLIDADVVRPSLPGMLGVKGTPGLLDLLADPSVAFSHVHCRTNIDKFSFIPSGKLRPRAAEMLASDAMTDLLDEMAARYDDRIVIFDSPPILVTTEARILASRMGQIVFVVRAESTLQRDVVSALSTIEACPVKHLVLNRAPQTMEGRYAYGYGYGYGYGDDREESR